MLVPILGVVHVGHGYIEHLRAFVREVICSQEVVKTTTSIRKKL